MDCPRCGASPPDTLPFCARCGASLSPEASVAGAGRAADPREASTHLTPHTPDALESGTTFAGRYQIIEELGRGGMGRVYKVIDQEVHAKVALKLIRPEIAYDPATIERFRQELKTARAISHKNICRLHDLGRDGTTYFLTMEYVSGEDLKTVIGMTGQLGVGTAISIATQVCEGLTEAHRLGVIHRDLKPQNIQIDKGGQAKIMDFGIARSAVGKGLTDGGMAVGTPQYMSPEQAEAKGVDARSDLYALGVILYEMLTGRVPFDGDTPLAVAMQHKLEAPRDPKELNASIPPDLCRLVLKCLEKDKERRYQSAGEVQADLAHIEQGLPTSAQVVPQPPASTSKQITLPFSLRQLRGPALVAVAVVALGLGVWRLWPNKAGSFPAGDGGGPTGRPRLAVLHFENISGDPALNMWRTGLPELLTTGLSESRLLNVVSSDRVFSILKTLRLTDAARYSAEDLAAVARSGDVQYLLTGSVMKAGRNTIITTRLQKAPSGEVIRSRKIECAKDEEINPAIDNLTTQIKSDLNLSPQDIAGDSSEPIGRALTNSPDALRSYAEARRLHLNSAYRDAIRLYEQAIEADPDFAMAYRGLASCLGNIGQYGQRAAAAKKALDLSAHLPNRLRYEIQITALDANGAKESEVMDVCRTLLAAYPESSIGLNKLGSIYENAEDFQAAAAQYEAAVRVMPTSLSAGNVANAYLGLGNVEQAKRALENYLERDPTNAGVHVSLGWVALVAGQFEAAQREAVNASTLRPLAWEASDLKATVAVLRRDWPTAETEYLSMLKSGDEVQRRDARLGLVRLSKTLGRLEAARQYARELPRDWDTEAFLEWEAGRPVEAVETFRRTLKASAVAHPRINVLWLMMGQGIADAAAGDSAGAQQVAADLESRAGAIFAKPATRWSLMVRAAIELKRGNGREAVAALERAASLLLCQKGYDDENALVLDLLGQAYVTAGDLTKARQTYETIQGLTTGRIAWGAIVAKSHYHLGVIAEQQGDKARARAQFKSFLDLWKDADKGIAEITDARRRMAR